MKMQRWPVHLFSTVSMQFLFVQKASRRLWLALSLVMVCLVAIGLLGVRTHANSDRGPSQENDLPQSAKAFSAMPGEIIVRFRAAAPDALATIKGERQFQSFAAVDGRQISMSIERLDRGAELIEGLRLVHVASDDTLSALESLRSRSDVVYAEPNFIRRKNIVPNDPRYGEMWNLKNTGQQGGIAGDDIAAEPAWDVTTGNRQIVVGVVDEGIDINHPDLKDNIWKNPGEIPGNGIDDDGNGYVDDINGWDFVHNDATVFDGNGTYPTDQTDAHGTHVAGTIGATGNNGIGVVGINWQVSLMSLKFIDSSGSGTTAQLLKAFSYAKSMRDTWVSSGGVKGANLRILNNSYGGAGFSQAELDAIRALNDSNILFVAAAGNDHQDNDRFPHYPANYDSPNIISVGASTPADGFAAFSNFGSRTVDTAAPGVNILSTTPNGTYDLLSGTSMAAPHVAGVAALLCASNPGISIQRLKAALIFGGDEKPNFFAGSVSGRRLSASGSLQNASQNDSIPPATITGLHITSQSGRSVTLQWTAPGDDGANGKAATYDLQFSESDISTASQFDRARQLASPHPATAGTQETVTISVPYQHLNGFVGIRAIDDAGNTGGIAELPIVVPTDIGAPYVVSEGPANSLSTGGTALNLKGDDRASDAYALPFSFNYYGQNYNSVYLSTNGALYFAPPPGASNPQQPLENAGDADSSIAGLNAYQMIAGVWDDLRTDRRPADDIYVTTPDSDRIIFRWQAVTFDTPLPDGTQRGENPVSFEIELRRDGTIQIRYGNDNHRLKPIVGISIANPDAYVSLSHTSESVLTDLTNAPTITFALRNPPPPPSADLQVSMSASPDLLLSGQNITYFMVVRNNGPNDAPNVVFKDQLPAGVSFVSCLTGSGSCVASSGTVTVNLGTLASVSNGVFVQIVATVTASAGTKLVNTATITSTLLDNNNANNSISRSTDVFAPTVFTGVKAIAAGVDFTVAATADGSVWAWGFNASGQLGDGTKNDANTPRQVVGVSGAVALAPGNGFTLVALSDGSVWSWGANDYGQLGDGTTTSHLLAAPLTGLSDVVAVGTGSFFSVALKKDGTVWGWGAGYMFGSNVNVKTPIQITNLANIKAISACGNHVLALQQDGSVWAWGSNSMGELGDGTTTFRSSPVPVLGLTGVVSISSGAVTGDDDYSLAARSDGTVWAWGSNLSLQLGLPYQGLTPHPVPAQVSGITAAATVSAGGHHGVALRSDGTVWTWGDSNHLQLGHCCAATPDQVPGLINIQSVAAGSFHTVVLLSDGSLRSWGSNTSGQLGDATTLIRANPVAVTGLSAVSLPAFSPDGGQYSVAQTVRVSCPTDGSTVHYTLNNNDPTEDDPVIACGSSVGIGSGKITVFKAKAWKQGMVSSPVKSATYNIFSANPIDDPPPFVHQHYFDFLSRAADQAGLDFWTGQITSCGGDAACTEVKRVNVSAAFFLSIEFQQTGYLVERMYKVAYGDTVANSTFGGQHQLPVPVIRLNEFLADTQRVGRGVVVLQPGWEQALENNKQAYTFEFVQTPRFTTANAFPTTMTAAQFVDKLNQNAGSVLSASERAAAIDLFGGAADTTNLTARVTALRQIAEDADLYQAEFNRAFVLTQYFGYLRRNPNDPPDNDYTGYDFWLTKLNQFNGDYIGAEMVKAFISSSEYRRRFGP